MYDFLHQRLQLKPFLPATTAKITFKMIATRYLNTTVSRDEIIASCIIDKMQNSPRQITLMAAMIPETKMTAGENKTIGIIHH